MTVPDTVTEIYPYAFSGCTNLTSIHYAGTMAQWAEIDIKSDWHKDTPDYTIYCTDGEIKKS